MFQHYNYVCDDAQFSGYKYLVIYDTHFSDVATVPDGGPYDEFLIEVIRSCIKIYKNHDKDNVERNLFLFLYEMYECGELEIDDEFNDLEILNEIEEFKLFYNKVKQLWLFT